MERITIPTRFGHRSDVEFRTTNNNSLCAVESADGAIEIYVHKINFRRCENHTAAYIHVESSGKTAVATSLSLTHGVARRLAVWLSHNTDRICE